MRIWYFLHVPVFSTLTMIWRIMDVVSWNIYSFARRNSAINIRDSTSRVTRRRPLTNNDNVGYVRFPDTFFLLKKTLILPYFLHKVMLILPYFLLKMTLILIYFLLRVMLILPYFLLGVMLILPYVLLSITLILPYFLLRVMLILLYFLLKKTLIFL